MRIELDGTGAFTRLYDKRLKRELLLPGARGNRLMAFEDRPASWDSWNIDMYYEEHAYDVDGDTTVSPVTGGALYESVTVVQALWTLGVYPGDPGLARRAARGLHHPCGLAGGCHGAQDGFPPCDQYGFRHF